MQEMNAKLAADMLGNRKKTTRTSDSKKEVTIRLKGIIHMVPDTDAAAFKPTIVVATSSERIENWNVELVVMVLGVCYTAMLNRRCSIDNRQFGFDAGNERHPVSPQTIPSCVGSFVRMIIGWPIVKYSTQILAVIWSCNTP